MAPRKKLSPETVAIINAIESATGAAKVVADAVAAELAQHTKHDDERFVALTTLVTSVAIDVKSLLESRAFTRGVMKTAGVTGGSVGGIVALLALILQWFRGH